MAQSGSILIQFWISVACAERAGCSRPNLGSTSIENLDAGRYCRRCSKYAALKVLQGKERNVEPGETNCIHLGRKLLVGFSTRKRIAWIENVHCGGQYVIDVLRLQPLASRPSRSPANICRTARRGKLTNRHIQRPYRCKPQTPHCSVCWTSEACGRR